MKVSHKGRAFIRIRLSWRWPDLFKKVSEGLVIIFLSCAGLGYLIWSATVSALNRLDVAMVKVQGGATNLQEISDIVAHYS
jgi:hypothetical protein